MAFTSNKVIPNQKVTDYTICNSPSKRNEFDKIVFEGKKRPCKNCQNECFATLNCDYCIRGYLRVKFPEWTSENKDIDNLIKECQLESNSPNNIIEWINYNNLENMEYLTKGGISEIYLADWKDGHYDKWNFEKQQLERYGREKVIMKRLEDVEDANRSWFDEAKSHVSLSNKNAGVVKCYGLTRDPSGNYMLVMCRMSTDLRNYLKQKNIVLTWKERIKVLVDIIDALLRIHKENIIHRDLHSGNILYSKDHDCWYISDFTFCGPVDKPIKGIYGCLSYIAPEVINGKAYTFASDTYSFGMLMWEISSGEPPFAAGPSFSNKHEACGFLMRIIDGMRPGIVSGTPSEYAEVMTQCLDNDPLKRPNINKLREMIMNLYNSSDNSVNPSALLHFSSEFNLKADYTAQLFTSEMHQFEPKNATEVEQEAFHSKPYDFSIPSDSIRYNSTSKNNTSKSNTSNSLDKWRFPKKVLSKISGVFKKKQTSDKSIQNGWSNSKKQQRKLSKLLVI